MYFSIIMLLRQWLPCTANFYKHQDVFQKTQKDAPTEVRTKKIASPGMRAISPTAALRNNSETFGEASMLSKAADEKAKAF